MATRPDTPDIATQVQTMVERTIQRNIKGLEFMASPAPAVGQTPKEIIHNRGTLNLYHYHPIADEIFRVPILMVMATTNKSYIFDLAPGQSMVEFLLKAGFDVYVMDWNAPRPEEKTLGLGDYVLDFIPDCIDRVQRDSGVDEVNLVGYCMGGVLSTLYMATHPDGPAQSLACFTTPADWSKMGLFAKWSSRENFDVDRLVDAVGNVPGDMIFTSFDMLRPANRSVGRMHLWDNMWNDDFVKSYRMFDRWSNEMLPLAGEYFRETTKDLMWENKMFKNELVIDGRPADLKQIKVPAFHAIAEHDHIVPLAASKPLLDLFGSTDKTEMVLKGGHVSLIGGPNAVRRLWPALAGWLEEKSE